MAKKLFKGAPGSIVIGRKIKFDDVPDNHVVIDLDGLSFIKDVVVLGPNAKGIMVVLVKLPKKVTANDMRGKLEFLRDRVNKMVV